jgi:diazepam-binding inhibitor (GABA receptor modulator, acyl-CoA-binding protein)
LPFFKASAGPWLSLTRVYKLININFAGEPSGMVEKAKFKAWTGRKGISKDDAMQQYIDLAGQLQGKYA